ncbi:MAG: AAA family ATPase [Treponema sp.]|jgi:exonuclease SbcC|nr:AAA family ATPase [Treponema sp.]
MKPERLFMNNFGPFAGALSIDFTALDDIFLITGKTGAGKTTIFDAICFALYGEVPGGRNAHLPRLKSDFDAGNAALGLAAGAVAGGATAPVDECSVALEFSLGQRLFRVERSPRQEKPKKRGTGVTVAEESAVLYERLNKRWESVSSRKSEANQKIKDLIGLEPGEFFKIVLLPQGEFAEFLRQNTNERRAVLGKLFPIGSAMRVKETVVDRAKEAETAAKQLRITLEELEERCSIERFDEAKQAFIETLRQARSKIAVLSNEKTLLSKKCDLKQREADHVKRLASLQDDYTKHEERSASIYEKKIACELSKKTRPLREKLLLVEEGEAALARREHDMQNARESAIRARENAERAEKNAEAVQELEADIRMLREKRPALLEAREAEASLSQKARDLADEKERSRRLLDQKAEQERKLAKEDAEIQRLQTLASQIQRLDVQYEQAKAVYDSLVQLKRKLSDDIEPLISEEHELAAEIAVLERTEKALAKQSPALADEVKTLEAEKKAYEQAGQAAALAAGLKKGEPCPVCGAVEHPHPASAVARKFGLDERIEALGAALKTAERDEAVCKADLEAKRQMLDRTRRKLTGLQKEARILMSASFTASLFMEGDAGGVLADGMAEFPPDIPPSTEVAAMLKKQSDVLNAVTSQWGDARQANSKLPLLYKEKEHTAAIAAETGQRIAISAEKQNALNAEIESLERKRQRALGNTAADAPSGVGAVTTAGRALAETEAALLKAEADVAALRETCENAQKRLAAALAAEQSARAVREEAALKREESVSTLNAGIAASPFADIAALKRAMLKPETEANFEKTVRQWEDKREKLRLLSEEVGNAVKSLQAEMRELGGDEDAARIQEKLAELAAELESAEEARDKAQADLAAAERDGALLTEKREQYAALLKKSEVLARLRDDLEGRKGARRSFDAWLLGKYLAEVTVFATSRLERMSEGRYSLLLNPERESGRGLSGLDLEVFDAYTGKTRPCATLSGGESFMASISLALGLADSIQERSGGIKLDAVFIDEGFGSLDDASLDKALGILDELREQRMVGLISHVGDLRTRIPSRIEVIKSSSGSTITISHEMEP